MKKLIHFLTIVLWGAASAAITGFSAFDSIQWWICFTPVALISQALFWNDKRE